MQNLKIVIDEIEIKLSNLPIGCLFSREKNNKIYYYLQTRKNYKCKNIYLKYLNEDNIDTNKELEKLKCQIEERRKLQKILRILKKQLKLLQELNLIEY